MDSTGRSTRMQGVSSIIISPRGYCFGSPTVVRAARVPTKWIKMGFKSGMIYLSFQRWQFREGQDWRKFSWNLWFRDDFAEPWHTFPARWPLTPTCTRLSRATILWVIWSWAGKPWALCTSTRTKRHPILCELWHRCDWGPANNNLQIPDSWIFIDNKHSFVYFFIDSSVVCFQTRGYFEDCQTVLWFFDIVLDSVFPMFRHLEPCERSVSCGVQCVQQKPLGGQPCVQLRSCTGPLMFSIDGSWEDQAHTSRLARFEAKNLLFRECCGVRQTSNPMENPMLCQ